MGGTSNCIERGIPTRYSCDPTIYVWFSGSKTILIKLLPNCLANKTLHALFQFRIVRRRLREAIKTLEKAIATAELSIERFTYESLSLLAFFLGLLSVPLRSYTFLVPRTGKACAA